MKCGVGDHGQTKRREGVGVCADDVRSQLRRLVIELGEAVGARNVDVDLGQRLDALGGLARAAWFEDGAIEPNKAAPGAERFGQP